MATANAQAPGPGPTLAGILAKPSRGDRSHGFLYRPDAYLGCPVLFLHHRARPPENSALQCYAESQFPLDRATNARSMALHPGSEVPVVRS
jgi:hypothetical protein